MPKPTSKSDRRLAANRSSAFKAGERTKDAKKPTNARDGKTPHRVENTKTGRQAPGAGTRGGGGADKAVAKGADKGKGAAAKSDK